MIHRLTCAPIAPDPAGPLVLDWDDATGTVSGPGAATIRRWQRAGVVPLHPQPASHTLGPARRRISPADLAAIVGWQHRLPDALADHYPALLDATDDDPTADELADIYPDGLPAAGDPPPARQPASAILY
jgi:hypothetical protein